MSLSYRSDGSPVFINISPREETCVVCECDVVDGSKGIAMHEGEPVPHNWPGEWGGFACCETCFAEYERVQADDGERRVWFAHKRHSLRIRRESRPQYAGDL